MPTVSVIIPTYNGEQTIGEAVHSVLSQNYNDYEILIGDDGSSDETPYILNYLENKHSHVTVYHRNTNLGVPRNMNDLVNKSSGDLLLFLDQDDYWLSKKIKKHVDRHERSNSSVVFSNYAIVNKNGGKLDISSPPNFDSNGVSLVKQLYEHGNFIGTFSAASVKRHIWETNGGLDEQLNISADFDFWIRLAESYSFSHIDEELVAKRDYSGNYSNNYKIRHRDNELILSKAVDRYPAIRKKEDNIRSKLAYHHATAAFRDGNSRESLGQAIYSIRFEFHVKPILVIILCMLDICAPNLYLGTRLYYFYKKFCRTNPKLN